MQYWHPFVQKILPLLNECGLLYYQTAILPPHTSLFLDFCYAWRLYRDIWCGKPDFNEVLEVMAEEKYMKPEKLLGLISPVYLALLRLPAARLEEFGILPDEWNLCGIADAISRAL